MPATAADTTLEYCRRARRLRHVYARRPAELYGSLRALSAEHDQRAKFSPDRNPLPAGAARSIATGTRSGCDQFLREIENAPVGLGLKYSDRLKLLKLAGKLGIERFQANLMIAAVQHRRGVVFDGGAPSRFAVSQRWAVGATIVLIQCVILASAWLMFAR